MPKLYSPSQKVAVLLKQTETELRNWQDDPDSPRSDVDTMLAMVEDLRTWVQGHVLYDIEKVVWQYRENQKLPPNNQ